MQIDDAVHAWKKAWAVNANTAAFAAKIPTITEPTNDGVVNLVGSGLAIPRRMLCCFFGLGADNDAASVRIIGWKKIGQDQPQSIPLWIPLIVGEFTLIFSTITGVAGAPVLNTERFADTIAPVAARNPDRVIGAGTAINSDLALTSPTTNVGPGFIDFPIRAFEKIEFSFAQTVNNPPCNALFALY